MNPATWNNAMNSTDNDFDKFTLTDAIEYAEFEEECNSWETVIEE